jgi:hypothetical protein
MTSASSNSRALINNQIAGRYKSSSNMTQHVITIASSVTRVRWRPPALDLSNGEVEGNAVDRHDSMFAVATARLTSAGGSGVISLWSTHRPFMPLSVVEGHEEGAVADFVWMRTPLPEGENNGDRSLAQKSDSQQQKQNQKVDPSKSWKQGGPPKNDETILIRSGGRGDVDSILFDNNVKENENKDSGGAIWQHVLSVGRDGKCILQSFVRGKDIRLSSLFHPCLQLTALSCFSLGDRPISRVPSSCFALANLSPFQRGYGSLQLFSVHQQVPNGAGSDFELTALRQDAITSKAPGVFKEAPIEVSTNTSTSTQAPSGGRRLPERTPELVST